MVAKPDKTRDHSINSNNPISEGQILHIPSYATTKF